MRLRTAPGAALALQPARRRRAPGDLGRCVLATCLGGAMGAAALALGALPAAAVTPHIPAINLTWSATLPDAGGPIAGSSPNVANLSGGPSVVVGDRAGRVYGFPLASSGTNPAEDPGWPFNAGGPVDSTPSVSNAGSSTVYVGVGDAAAPFVGGYQAIAANGAGAWHVDGVNPPTDPYRDNGVQASMAVGSLQGQQAVTAPSLGQNQYAMNAASGGVLAGFPWFQADSSFSTPAIADLYGNGHDEIVEGNASSPGLAYGVNYPVGGFLRVLGEGGNVGQPTPAGGGICSYQSNQQIDSSPAVGEFFGGSAKVGIVVGTGTYWPGAGDTNRLLAFDGHCNLQWSDLLDSATSSSPALADVLGNGQLQVIETTRNAGLYVVNGANGAIDWSASLGAQIYGSVATVDLGGGNQDLLVPTTAGVKVVDGRSGTVLATLEQFEGFQNTPLVTHDPNGTIGITIAGYNVNNQGVIDHFEVAGTNGGVANETGAWPMFHHDPQLTGSSGTPPPVIEVPCNKPAGAPTGYYMTGTDGGVFNFGNLPFCGSTGNITLNQPVVGIAATHDAGGYWTVARDGGVFAFGDAGAYGALPGLGVNVTNVVGIAPTASGRGYWMVGSDGGVFAFGDASFVGSLPGLGVHVNNVVGIVPTRTGHGYWMVGSDGGAFAFGDANFVGSLPGLGVRVNNVVGIVPTSNNSGYWMVGSDGGAFAFNAPFAGSLPGIGVHVNDVVGITPSSNGRGYLMAGSDGGIFDFGGVPFYGSLPGLGVHVNNVTAIAGAPPSS